MMICRPAVTLMEVLITMFIMAIGMLALLALFPVGAVSMAQALKDDRCASSANMAEQVAIAMNVRHDPNVEAALANGPVYVDPYFAAVFPQLGTAAPFITRTGVSYATNQQLMDRWFTLPNDINFHSSGIPEMSAGIVERGREYSWAYLLQRPQANNDQLVNLTVVVYRKRPTAVPEKEQTYSAAGVQNGSGLVLTWNPATQSPTLKRGIWLLDTTPTNSNAFYRVTNVSDSISGQAALDVQPNLANNVSQVVLLNDAAEVFQKGTSWRP